MKQTAWILFLGCGALIGNIVLADDGNGFRVEDLIGSMLSTNEALLAAREQLVQAEGGLRQAGLLPNPSLEAQRQTDRLLGNEGEGGYSVTLSQPVELGGKRGKRVDVAALRVELARARIAAMELEWTSRLRTLFGEALAQSSRLDLLERTVELNREMVRIMDVRRSSGDASRLDASLLLATARRVEVERLQVESRRDSLLAELATLAGMPLDEPLVLRGDLTPEPVTVDREQALSRALEQRPDLQAARLEEKAARSGVDLSRAAAVPDLDAFVGYSDETNVIEVPAPFPSRLVDRNRLLSFGVSIGIPLFDRRQGAVDEAASRLVEAGRRREWMERTVRKDVTAAYRRYQAARRSVDLYDQGVLSEARESFRIVRLASDLGEMRLLDVVEQERTFLEAQTGYAAAEADYYSAWVELERAMGEPTEP